jgi:hypothetical protein
MEWTFGTVLWSTFLFFLWFAAIWMFIVVLIDVFRRDMSGWAKAGWALLIVLLPLLGVLIYLIVRPRQLDDTVPLGVYGSHPANRHFSASEEIAKAGQLYDQGKISSQEYERLKQQAISGYY